MNVKMDALEARRRVWCQIGPREGVNATFKGDFAVARTSDRAGSLSE